MSNFVVIWAWTILILSGLGIICCIVIKYAERLDDKIFDYMWDEFEAGRIEFDDLLYWVNL
jgi:hypothetical protein